MDKRTVIVGAASLLLSGGAVAACTASSPAHTVALVELYTSEGCSDCPPADRWLASLRPGSVARVALHVDYWDYIGWKDPFAKAGFTVRQHEQSALDGRAFVYTPQVVVAGRDYRGWRSAREFEAEVKRLKAMPARASISLSISAAVDGRLEASARASLAPKVAAVDPVLYLSLTQSGLSNRVSAGENRGATLRHDFVAREWSGPVAIPGAQAVQASVSAKLPGLRPGAAGALAFVQDRSSGEVLQAFALPLCGV